jgi:serralysin
MTLPTWSLQQVIDQLDYEEGQFEFEWTASTLTFAFPLTVAGMQSGDGAELPGFTPVDAGTKAQLRLALQAWDDLIATNFVETLLPVSDIEFGFSTTGVTFAHAYFPDYGSMWINPVFDSAPNDLIAAPAGSYGFATYLHELGHALGLDHLGTYNGGVDEGPAAYQDSSVYTLMSYYGPSNPNNSPDVANADWTSLQGIEYSPQTPMLYDVLAIQSIYGASTTTRLGDTTYGFNSNVQGTMRPIFNFGGPVPPILTIWDSGGNDTLDFSGFQAPSRISLVEGTFSSCDYLTDNVSIAFGCTIENAVGGIGNDSITGNAAANVLTGGLGNDTLDGGDGLDTAVFAGGHSNFTWTQLQVTGAGNDSLQHIERLRFDDLKVAFDIDGHAGMVARTIAAVFGPALVSNAAYMGIGLQYADGGYSYEQLVDLALGFALGDSPTDAQVVTLLYTNLAGVAPDANALATYTGMITGDFTQADLGVMAAQLDLTAFRIGLTQLAVTGIEYL